MQSRTTEKWSSRWGPPQARIALEAIRDEDSLAQLGQRHGIHPVLVGQWKKQLKENARVAFDQSGGRNVEKAEDELLRKIGELTMERDFLARGLRHSR